MVTSKPTFADPRAPTRLFYVDDSGEPKSGLAVFGWVEIEPANWVATLDCWHELRRMLWREYGVPISRELHTSEYVHGRGRISKKVPARHQHGGEPYWKDLGRDVAIQCLDQLRSIQGLTIKSVFQVGEPEHLALTKNQLYIRFLLEAQQKLSSDDAFGLVFIDGDGSDKSFRAAHRAMESPDRSIVEDAIHLTSSDSYFIQMADLVAWTALASIERSPRNEFASGWYETYLAERDPRRKPQGS